MAERDYIRVAAEAQVATPLRPAPPPWQRGRSLERLGQGLEATGWAFELFDADWHLVYVSHEMKTLIGEFDDERLGCGLHVLDTRAGDAWECALSEESQLHWLELHAPFLRHANPAVAALAKPERRALIARATPAPPPPVWSSQLDFTGSSGSPARASYIGTPLYDAGELIGYVEAYGPSTPASLLPLLVRGNVEMFTRMARLAEPRRVEAAILFADLQASGRLSRRLPSAAYFGFIRALTTAIDQEVIRRRGLVGKHAGDGVSAFFLAEDLGSGAAAARAAIDAGRALTQAARAAAQQSGLAGTLGPEDYALNVGVHWGGALYMGQLVTDGRLEVTALGDEVNECARIQQSARDGALLASKAIIERLDVDGAGDLALDTGRVSYQLVEQLAGAGEKAIKDAGLIPVTDVRPDLHGELTSR